MSAGIREQRDDISAGFMGAVVLHAAVAAIAIFLLPDPGERLVINSVPVTIVSDVPDSAPTDDPGPPAELPAELAPAPVQTAPPPPAPPQKAPPVERVPPKMSTKARPLTPPPPAKRRPQTLDLDALAGDPTLNARKKTARAQAQTQPDTKKGGSQNRGPLSSTGAIAWAGLQRQLADNWSPDCAAANLGRLNVTVRFRLSGTGALISGPTVIEGGGADASARAAARRAQTAVRQGAPFRDLPAELLNRELEMVFKARDACRNL
jgi:hypothetical protein